MSMEEENTADAIYNGMVDDLYHVVRTCCGLPQAECYVHVQNCNLCEQGVSEKLLNCVLRTFGEQNLPVDFREARAACIFNTLRNFNCLPTDPNYVPPEDRPIIASPQIDPEADAARMEEPEDEDDLEDNDDNEDVEADDENVDADDEIELENDAPQEIPQEVLEALNQEEIDDLMFEGEAYLPEEFDFENAPPPEAGEEDEWEGEEEWEEEEDQLVPGDFYESPDEDEQEDEQIVPAASAIVENNIGSPPLKALPKGFSPLQFNPAELAGQIIACFEENGVYDLLKIRAREEYRKEIYVYEPEYDDEDNLWLQPMSPEEDEETKRQKLKRSSRGSRLQQNTGSPQLSKQPVYYQTPKRLANQKTLKSPIKRTRHEIPPTQILPAKSPPATRKVKSDSPRRRTPTQSASLSRKAKSESPRRTSPRAYEPCTPRKKTPEKRFSSDSPPQAPRMRRRNESDSDSDFEFEIPGIQEAIEAAGGANAQAASSDPCDPNKKSPLKKTWSARKQKVRRTLIPSTPPSQRKKSDSEEKAILSFKTMPKIAASDPIPNRPDNKCAKPPKRNRTI